MKENLKLIKDKKKSALSTHQHFILKGVEINSKALNFKLENYNGKEILIEKWLLIPADEKDQDYNVKPGIHDYYLATLINNTSHYLKEGEEIKEVKRREATISKLNNR